MEIRHLRYFNAVAEELNFSRAAERLGISQPPLSNQIKQFERELQLELFHRSASGVTLTQAGHVIWASARRIIEDAESLERLAKQLRMGNFGVLRIGTVGSALLGVLPELIRAASAAMPNVSIELEEIETGDQDAAFACHRIDLGVVRLPLHVEGLRSLKLSEEPLVAVLSVNHPLAEQEFISVRELRDDRFILFPRGLGLGLWDSIINSCLAAGFRPGEVIETANIHTIVGMVASGRGVSLLPDSVRALSLPGVRYLTISEPRVATTLNLAWLHDQLSPTARRFVEFTRNYVTEQAYRDSRNV
jgi:DNA-binding transcriptional LysR family regulator